MNRRIFTLSLLLILLPAAAFADIGSSVLIVDAPPLPSLVNGSTFGMVGKANRSYVCAIRVEGTSYSLSSSIQTPSGATINGVRTPSDAAANRYLQRFVGTSMSDVTPNNNLLLFVAPGGAAEYGKYTLTIGISSGTPNVFSVNCVETSIQCDANTFLGQTNFIEVTNFGTAPGTARLKFVSFDGSERLAPTTVRFPAGRRRDIETTGLVGANNYGTVILQAIDFVPTVDGYSSVRTSTYKDGQPVSSLDCESFFGNDG